MKALMRKDFYVLKKQFWLFVVIIIAFNILNNGTTAFIALLYSALLPSTAFAYDDRCQWDTMELMLPYSTRQVVLSRYCVGWVSMLVLLFVGWLTQLAAQRFLPFTGTFNMPNPRTILAEIPLAACLLALSMPVYFRFDSEKSRAVRTLVVVAICALMGGGIAMMTIRDIAFSEQLFAGAFEHLWPEYLAAAVLTAISVPLSMLAWKRRHR